MDYAVLGYFDTNYCIIQVILILAIMQGLK